MERRPNDSPHDPPTSPADAAFIAAVRARDPHELRYSVSEVPLLPDGAERVDRQLRIQNAMLGRDVWLAATFPGSFAGLAMGHARGCVIELYMTSETEADAAVEQLEIALAGHEPEIHLVDFSHADMQAAHQAIRRADDGPAAPLASRSRAWESGPAGTGST
jgi:hypothetical protein